MGLHVNVRMCKRQASVSPCVNTGEGSGAVRVPCLQNFPPSPSNPVKFHLSNFGSHQLAAHIALTLLLRLGFSTRRGYWTGYGEQRASRPDSECRSHISKHVKLKRDIGLGISQDGALVI